MIYEFSTPKVLTMEFIESFKLTDIARVEKEGLDRKDLAKVADRFCIKSSTPPFHCDPHPGIWPWTRPAISCTTTSG